MTDTPVNRDTEMTVYLTKLGLEKLKEARTMLSAAKTVGHEARLSGGMTRVQKAATLALDSYPGMITTHIQGVSSILRFMQTGKYTTKSDDDDQ